MHNNNRTDQTVRELARDPRVIQLVNEAHARLRHERRQRELAEAEAREARRYEDDSWTLGGVILVALTCIATAWVIAQLAGGVS